MRVSFLVYDSPYNVFTKLLYLLVTVVIEYAKSAYSVELFRLQFSLSL
jgi:hypothetical protein